MIAYVYCEWNSHNLLSWVKRRYRFARLVLMVRALVYVLMVWQLALLSLLLCHSTKIANTLGSTSIRQRSDTFASDRCLTDIDQMCLVIWEADVANIAKSNTWIHKHCSNNHSKTQQRFRISCTCTCCKKFDLSSEWHELAGLFVLQSCDGRSCHRNSFYIAGILLTI